ncbi:MAG: YadA-like family protein, partial [Veillonella parvula]|nr:YadA-like family protein [Veillonella parvula]
QDAATGNTTIDVKMNKNLKAESVKVGKNGKDGVSITGPDTANGTDGKVAVTDKNGKEAVSISGKDGVGHIGLTGPAGTNGVNGTNGIDLSVKPGYDDSATGVKGEKGVDGTNGLTRIVYKDGNGEHQVATMEDGLQFTGNNSSTVNKQKLNSLVKVQGEGVTEAESAAFKSASGNINVKADGTDKLELQLAKDLKNLDSVTAAKTVKAGDAIMGGQTVNNAAGDSETGNYVTGLDNKDWDADKIVSGRAATEDQLKKALDAQSANSTDYRLIRNQAAGSNGDYTVDANGDVALTVQDKNHPDQTETVTIKDVASKSKLDKLNDRAVKYDLDPTGNPDKSKVTYEGPAYNNKQGGTHVTNVAYATGNDGSEAVNVDYLNDKIKDSADALTNKGLKFDANQGGEKTNKLGSKVTIKGSITGPDTANGTDGKVAVTGKDGKEAVSISGKDGVGHIGLNGKDGRSADISVEKGDPDLNGKEITRIKYTDEDGNTHQVATKDDGMAYGGDSGDVIKKKLNTQVNVKGGVMDKSKLSNDDNIGVVSDGTDTLMLRLAKDLKGLNSITFNNGANGANGKTVVNGEGMTIKDAAGNPLTAVTKDGVKITDGPSMTKDGIDAAGNKITNVQDGTVAKDSKDAVNGGQLHTAIEDIKTKGFGLEAEDGQSVKKPLGETVKVKGDDTNIKTSVDGGAVKVELKKDITVDTVTAKTVTTGDTKMDTNGVTIKDGANEATKLTKDGLQINDGGNKAVTVNKDGLTIENGPKVTKDGIDAADKKITNVADGTIGAGSKDAVNGGQLHTAIEDIKSTGFGLKAEDGQSVKKPLGETIDLKGDGNIKTSVDNGAIKMALNDKITLGQDPAKQVNIDGTAGTITAGNGGNQVKIDGNDGSVTANTVKAGDVVVGKQTSDGKEGNFVTGLDNKTWDPENPVAVPGRAATEDQLKAVNDDFNNKARTGRVFQGDQPGDSGKVVRGLGDTMNLTGGADVNRLADNNIGVVKNSAGDGYNIKLAKDLKGLESVTTTDVAGNTTVMNGGGMTITPAQGNAVSLTKDGINNGGNRITNVGPGVDGTDAVNVNQLSSAMRSVDGKIADVGATSAAISGLKPLQYDPLEPTQVLAAVGHYKGSTAAAVGVAHYTNESTMFHMGVSLGGHDNMINAGVSYKFGTSDAKKAVPARYKGGPISSTYVLQDEVTALKAENERMKQHDLELTAKYDQVQRDNEEMKAQIALLMQQAGLTK